MLPIIQENQTLTMSSRDIAELTSKEHKNVKRDIEKMLKELGEDRLKFERIYLDSMNRTRVEYLLDRDHTDCLLTGYSAVLRMRVIKRWKELESKEPEWFLSLSPEAKIAIADIAKQRDEAIKTKAQINDKRTATLMNKASQDAKKIKKLESQLQDQGSYLSLIAADLPQRVDTEMRSNVQSWRLLKRISETLGHEIVKVKDPRYGEVNTYHVDVIEEFKHQYL